MTLALEGIKVLDLTRYAPGTVNTWLLADFGADVIHVEEPPQVTGRRAEQSAGTYTPPPGGIGRRGGNPYNANLRNKKSVILNLKHPQGQAIATELAKQSDVLVSEYRPGVMERLGLGYDKLSKINPRLVYCATTCFGQNGPYRDLPAHDPICLAIAGVLSYVGDGGKPRLEALAYDDLFTGYHGALGVLLALRARDITGQGQFVDISMLDSALDFMGGTIGRLAEGRELRRLDQTPNSLDVWQCQDGKWLCTTNMEAHHWANFCRTIGRDDFIPLQYDRGHRQEVNRTIKEVLLTKPRDEWLKLFHGELESQASPVNTPEEAWRDPQVLARNMVWELDHPQFGKVRQVGQSIKLAKTPAQFRSFPAAPGEHTEEVLASLGYDAKKIRSLKEAGAVV